MGQIEAMKGTFRITGTFAGRAVVFDWRAGRLTCSDAAALGAFKGYASDSPPIHPRPHITLKRNLSDRAFVQILLVSEFLMTVDSVEESPLLVFPDDVGPFS